MSEEMAAENEALKEEIARLTKEIDRLTEENKKLREQIEKGDAPQAQPRWGSQPKVQGRMGF